MRRRLSGFALSSFVLATACGQGTALEGSWDGKADSSRVENFPDPTGPVEQVFASAGSTWFIQSCGAELAAQVAFDCVIRLKPTSATEAEVLPDYPCDFHEGSNQVHVRTRGGSMKRSQNNLVASVTWRGIEPVASGNVQADYSATLTAMAPGKLKPAKDLCSAAPQHSLPADDFASLAACTAAEIVDRSAAADSRTVTFDATLGFQPRCLRIAPGQSVTFKLQAADPLWPGTAGMDQAGSAPNPFRTIYAASERTFVYPDVGDFLQHCTNCPQQPTTSQGLVRVR